MRWSSTKALRTLHRSIPRSRSPLKHWPLRSLMSHIRPKRSIRSRRAIPLTLIRKPRRPLLHWHALIHGRSLHARRHSRRSAHIHVRRHRPEATRAIGIHHARRHSLWRTLRRPLHSLRWATLHSGCRSTGTSLRRGRSRARLLLRLECVEGLLGGQGHDRTLTVQVLLRQALHDEAHTLLGAQRDDTETLGLAVGAIFKEFYLLKVAHTNATHSVRDVLVRGPPRQVANVQLVASWNVVYARLALVRDAVRFQALEPIDRCNARV